jgi:methionine-rich copper-binding protein CopC
MRFPIKGFPIKGLPIVGGAAVLALAVTAAPASAHTSLKDANPRAGSTIASPSRIVLTYEDPVSFPKVVLADAANKQVAVGAARAVDNRVTAPVTAPLPNGTYTVGWRVVAADGHPVTGSYKFTVSGSGAAAAAPAPDAQQSGAQQSGGHSEAHGSQGKSGGSNGWLWVGLIALAVVAAGGGALALKRRT